MSPPPSVVEAFYVEEGSQTSRYRQPLDPMSHMCRLVNPKGEAFCRAHRGLEHEMGTKKTCISSSWGD